MDYVMKILKLIAEVIMSYFKSKSDVANNDKELRKEKQELSNKIDKDIQKARDVIEDKDDNRLNEILK